jgi:hypothetical protein
VATTLFLRNTTVNGIGTFRDAITTRGASSTTAVVTNGVGTGINIQWTKTAGGAVMEWVSGKSPIGGWTLSGAVNVRLRALESNLNDNCLGRIRLYKRSAAGSETELTGSPFDDATEFTASDAAYDWSFTPTSMAFAEDDRLVIRYFITNIGSMTAGTSTMTYDGATNGAAGDTFVTLNETVPFKPDYFTQTAFRLYGDGTEAGSTALAAENTNASVNVMVNPGQIVQVRFRIQSTTIGGQTTDDWKIYKSYNGAAYVAVDSEAVGWFGDGAGALADAAASTQRLSAGSGSFSAGQTSTDGLLDNEQLPATNHTELVYEIVSSQNQRRNGETYDFRVFVDEGEGYTALGSYTQTPRITLTTPHYELKAFRFYEEGSESGSTAIAAQDTNITRDDALAPNFHLRFGVQNTTASAGDVNSKFFLWYRKNAGSWAAVTDSTTNVQGVASAGLTNGASNTTQRLAGLTGTFEAGDSLDDPGNLSIQAELLASGNTEHVVSLHLIAADLVGNDELEFKWVPQGADGNNAALGTNWTFTFLPKVTIAGVTAHVGEATFQGAGSMSVNTQKSKTAAATFEGAGSLQAFARSGMQVAATFGGAGLLSANANNRKFGEATFNGTGSLSAQGLVFKFGEATFQGAGSLSVDVRQGMQGAATFQGLGSLSAAMLQRMVGAATFFGAGNLSVDLTQIAAGGTAHVGEATFNGAGSMSAAARQGMQAAVSFQGAGNLSALVSQRMIIAATLQGSGNLSVETQKSKQAAATFSGAGSLSAYVNARMLGFATFSGAGALSAAASQGMRIAATFGGSGNLSAFATVTGQATAWSGEATFAGSGSMSAAARLNQQATATFGGAGNFSITARMNFAASMRFTGTGNMLVNVISQQQAAARFAGAGEMSAMWQVGTHAGEAVFAGEGRMSVDTIHVHAAPVDPYPRRFVFDDYGMIPRRRAGHF